MTSDTPPCLNVARVEQLTREMIDAYDLPAKLLSVQADPEGWRILVRDTRHWVFDLLITDAKTAVQLRAQLKARLIAACACNVLPN